MSTQAASCTPVALFAYKRPSHLRETVEALRRNDLAPQTDLILFSDGPKNNTDAKGVGEVRSYIRSIDGFRSVRVVERERNFGLAGSIIAGVSEVVNAQGEVIVLEDDLVTSPYFLRYMNDALRHYRDCGRVISIHGYAYPSRQPLPETFFVRGADCWGWATWKRGWDLFEPDAEGLLRRIREENLQQDFDFNGSFAYTDMLEQQVHGEIDSWAIRWYASAFLADKLTLYPGRSLVNNIGADGSGTHEGESDWARTELSTTPVQIGDIPAEESMIARQAWEEYFRSALPGKTRRSLGRLKRRMKRLFSGNG